MSQVTTDAPTTGKHCPACGALNATGATQCAKCGFDFSTHPFNRSATEAAATAVADYMHPSILGPKPPLDMGLRLRLSVMMFLEFAVWGAWFVVFNVYCERTLHFSNAQIGTLYGNIALGAIISMMFAGQIADRLMPAQYLMGICHLVGAGLLYLMATVHDFHSMFAVTLAYALLYNPTLALSNTVAFANIPDSTRDFPTLRVLGTIGWICAASFFDWGALATHGNHFFAGAAMTNKPLLFATILSVLLGVLSFAMPNTPPKGTTGGIPFVRALKLLKQPSFGVFFTITFVITIALSFYYTFAGQYLGNVGIQKIGATMSLGQWSELGFMLCLPFALKRLGMKWVLGVGMAAWAVRYTFFSIGHPLALVLIGVALHGVCFDFFLAAGFIYTDEKAPPSIRGSAQALFSFLTYGVGMWIGNEVAGRVVDHFKTGTVVNWPRVWLVPAIGAGVCLILFIMLWRDRPGKVDDADTDGSSIDTAVSAASPGAV
jgi:nucleoside transporter